ncbi:unnamed protein product, partial [marine sediment metagenome]
RYLTCPIKEALGEEAFEIYFSRGRMNVLKSILEGKLDLSKDLAEFVYQCSECGNCTEVCHQTQNEYIVCNTSKWIDHVEVWNALRKDLVEAGFAPLERHAELIDYMKNDEMMNPYGESKVKKVEWVREFTNIKNKVLTPIFLNSSTLCFTRSSTDFSSPIRSAIDPQHHSSFTIAISF